MRMNMAHAALLGLLTAACNPSASLPGPAAIEEKSVANKTAEPDPFAYAVNYSCEGGGAVDIVFDRGSERNALVRVDGGAPLTLALDTGSETGVAYKGAEGQIVLQGPGLSWTSGGTSKSCQLVARDLPPPVVDGVARALTVQDAGKSVEIKVGEKITVALSGIPTAGYVWSVATPPAFVKTTDGPGGATSTAQFTPGFAGGNHWEVTIIEALSAGEAEITLAQRRPWEDKSEPDAATFRFRLKAS